MTETPRSRGLFSSLGGLVSTGLSILQTRMELLSAELHEEKARVIGLVAYGAAALILLAAGIVFLAVFITVLLWDSHRLLALGVFTALFLAAGALALLTTLRRARSESQLFKASLGELGQDLAALGAQPPEPHA